MIIRIAKLEDVPELYSCCVEAFKDYILLIGRTPGPMLEDLYEGVLHHHTFIAQDGESIAGFILIKDGQEDFMWLDILAVYPKFRNKGIGNSLVEFCEDFIRSEGKSECRLYTHVKYEKTQKLYLDRGFEIYDRVQEYGFDRYYMRKHLK